jgi:mannose/fructose/N-acetylgalactosamine-specific phosphotransferase system component IIB
MVAVYRIDERLIHGQVATQWTSFFRISNIMILDDGVANNPMLKSININLAPMGSVVQVLKIEEAFQAVKAEQDVQQTRTLVIAKTPGVYISIVEQGLKIPRIILGNMGYANSRQKLNKNLYVSPEEAKQILKLIEMGTEVLLQTVPDDHPKNIKDILVKIK